MPSVIPTPEHKACGCCSLGCVCPRHFNQNSDAPIGSRPKMCSSCVGLPFHPIDKQYRFDPRLQGYVLKPQGQPVEHSFWTGPGAVKQIAQKLRDAGFKVTLEGTERVYVESTLGKFELIDDIKAKCGTDFGFKKY